MFAYYFTSDGVWCCSGTFAQRLCNRCFTARAYGIHNVDVITLLVYVWVNVCVRGRFRSKRLTFNTVLISIQYNVRSKYLRTIRLNDPLNKDSKFMNNTSGQSTHTRTHHTIRQVSVKQHIVRDVITSRNNGFWLWPNIREIEMRPCGCLLAIVQRYSCCTIIRRAPLRRFQGIIWIIAN